VRRIDCEKNDESGAMQTAFMLLEGIAKYLVGGVRLAFERETQGE
jgi:hypothetical protein